MDKLILLILMIAINNPEVSKQFIKNIRVEIVYQDEYSVCKGFNFEGAKCMDILYEWKD